MTATEELIVLLDDDGTAIGTMPKPLVHHGETPLHRAFSAYLFDDAGRLLVTRRAEGKQTFPGMWTNTVCGHPGPGEDDADAIARRAAFRRRQETEGDAWSPWCREQARLIEQTGLLEGWPSTG